MTVGVVGAGAMGAGIARVSAGAGQSVVLHDVAAGAAERAVEGIAGALARQVARGRATQEEADAVLARITPTTSLETMSACDLVVEAVVEDLAVKRRVFADLEQVVAPTTVLASNTSSLSIGAVFRDLTHPERAVGLHFFNPVHVMQLVEVVAGPHTDERTRRLALEYVERLGKVPVQAQDSPGFVVNLAGRAYVTEALELVQQRIATPAQVDRIMTESMGFPLGPFALMDMTGIDVNYPVTANLFEHNFGDPMLRSTWRHRYLYDSGLLGRKAGRGFHDYSRPTPGSVDDRLEPAPAEPATSVVAVADESGLLADFCERTGLHLLEEDDGRSPLLCAPLGEDCTGVSVRTGADPHRLVAVDLALGVPDLVTLMVAPGADQEPLRRVAARVSQSRPVEVVADSPGFVAQRIIAAVVNLGCEMAQRQVATPRDIDLAVELGLRYPAGPLALAERHGPGRVKQVLDGLHEVLRDDRYRTSQWLRRRALLGVDIYRPDRPR